MNRILLFAVVGALVLGLATAKPPGSRGKKRPHNKDRKGGGNDAVTGDWTWGECVPKKGDCGKGVMTGSCSGDACTTETMKKVCRVKCAAKPDASVDPTGVTDTATDGEAVTTAPKRGGRGKGGKNKGGKGHRGGRKQNKPAPTTECQYGRPSLSECDPETGRQNKTRMLTSGDLDVCAEEIVHSFRCDKLQTRKENRKCNYTFGEISECNRTTNMRYRVDTLTDLSKVSEQCPLERTVREKCKRKHDGEKVDNTACVYNWEASDCNADTATITVTWSLVNVAGATSQCEAVLTKDYRCQGGKSLARCGFGDWSDWSECTDGLKHRTRSVRKNTPLCKTLVTEHMVC